MTIPANLTHAEVGAYLAAVGKHMIDHDVCADAVIDSGFLEDDGYALPLAEEMQRAAYGEIETERCLDILDSLTLEEAIGFVKLR